VTDHLRQSNSLGGRLKLTFSEAGLDLKTLEWLNKSEFWRGQLFSWTYCRLSLPSPGLQSGQEWWGIDWLAWGGLKRSGMQVG
jgi:hypothetical protein